MELTVKLNLKDYTDFNYSHIGRKFKSGLKSLYILDIILAVFFIAALAGLLLSGGIKSSSHTIIPSDFNWIFMVILAVLGFVLLFSLLLVVNISLASRNNFKSSKILQGECHYTFSENLIAIRSDDINSSITWDKVRIAGFYKNCCALFTSREQAYILPNRCFENENEMMDFAKLIEQALPSSKIRRWNI